MEKHDFSVYIYLQKKLLEFSDRNKEVSYDKVMESLKRARIPKVLIPIILKEMESIELLERVNKRTFRINKHKKTDKIKFEEYKGYTLNGKW